MRGLASFSSRGHSGEACSVGTCQGCDAKSQRFPRAYCAFLPAGDAIKKRGAGDSGSGGDASLNLASDREPALVGVSALRASGGADAGAQQRRAAPQASSAAAAVPTSLIGAVEVSRLPPLGPPNPSAVAPAPAAPRRREPGQPAPQKSVMQVAVAPAAALAQPKPEKSSVHLAGTACGDGGEAPPPQRPAPKQPAKRRAADASNAAAAQTGRKKSSVDSLGAAAGSHGGEPPRQRQTAAAPLTTSALGWDSKLLHDWEKVLISFHGDIDEALKLFAHIIAKRPANEQQKLQVEASGVGAYLVEAYRTAINTSGLAARNYSAVFEAAEAEKAADAAAKVAAAAQPEEPAINVDLLDALKLLRRPTCLSALDPTDKAIRLDACVARSALCELKRSKLLWLSVELHDEAYVPPSCGRLQPPFEPWLPRYDRLLLRSALQYGFTPEVPQVWKAQYRALCADSDLFAPIIAIHVEHERSLAQTLAAGEPAVAEAAAGAQVGRVAQLPASKKTPEQNSADKYLPAPKLKTRLEKLLDGLFSTKEPGAKKRKADGIAQGSTAKAPRVAKPTKLNPAHAVAVRGFDMNASEASILAAFSDCGDTKVRAIGDTTDGLVYLQFSNGDAMTKALDFDGEVVAGCTLQVCAAGRERKARGQRRTAVAAIAAFAAGDSADAPTAMDGSDGDDAPGSSSDDSADEDDERAALPSNVGPAATVFPAIEDAAMDDDRSVGDAEMADAECVETGANPAGLSTPAKHLKFTPGMIDFVKAQVQLLVGKGGQYDKLTLAKDSKGLSLIAARLRGSAEAVMKKDRRSLCDDVVRVRRHVLAECMRLCEMELEFEEGGGLDSDVDEEDEEDDGAPSDESDRDDDVNIGAGSDISKPEQEQLKKQIVASFLDEAAPHFPSCLPSSISLPYAALDVDAVLAAHKGTSACASLLPIGFAPTDAAVQDDVDSFFRDASRGHDWSSEIDGMRFSSESKPEKDALFVWQAAGYLYARYIIENPERRGCLFWWTPGSGKSAMVSLILDALLDADAAGRRFQPYVISTKKNIEDIGYDKLVGTSKAQGKLLSLCPRFSLFKPLHQALQRLDPNNKVLLSWLKRMLNKGFRTDADLGQTKLLKCHFLSFADLLNNPDKYVRENTCFVFDEVHEILNESKLGRGAAAGPGQERADRRGQMVQLLAGLTKLKNVKIFSLSGTPGADPAELLFQMSLLKPADAIVSTEKLLAVADKRLQAAYLNEYCRGQLSCVIGSYNRRMFAEERSVEVVDVLLSFEQYCQVAQRYSVALKPKKLARQVVDLDAPILVASTPAGNALKLEELVMQTGKVANETVARLQTYSSFWFGRKLQQTEPGRGRGLRHIPDFIDSRDGKGFCDTSLFDVAAKVTAFADFALDPWDNATQYDPLEVKHFVYTRRRPSTFMVGFGEALSGIREPDVGFRFQLFTFDSFDFDMIARVDAAPGDPAGKVTMSPGNVRLKAGVVVSPGALGVLVLSGDATQRAVLKLAFGYHDGSSKHAGLTRKGGKPLVQVMLAFDESNQGITLLRVQFVHFMEPSLSGVQYNEIIQATGRGLRPDCHSDVAEHLRFVRTKVYVAKPPQLVLDTFEELRQGMDTSDLLHFRSEYDELQVQLEELAFELERLSAKAADAEQIEATIESVDSSAPDEPCGEDDEKAATQRSEYKRLLTSELKLIKTDVKRRGKLERDRKRLSKLSDKVLKMLEELRSGKMRAFSRDDGSLDKPAKTQLVTVYPMLLDELVFTSIKSKHETMAPVQRAMQVRAMPFSASACADSTLFAGLCHRRKAADAVP